MTAKQLAGQFLPSWAAQFPLVQGFVDSLQFDVVLGAVNKNQEMKSALIEVVKINAIFFGCYVLLMNLALPILETWTQDFEHFPPFVSGLVSANFSALRLVTNVMCLLIYLLLLWPNAGALSTIAKGMDKKIQFDGELPKGSSVHSGVYDGLLVLMFILLTTVLYFIPYVGPTLSFSYCCWQNSFYCWNYKWRLRFGGCSNSARNRYFEDRWMYLLGFGFPLTFVLSFFSTMAGLGLYAVLFPIYVCLAQISRAETYSGDVFPTRVLVFNELDIMVGKLWSFCFDFFFKLPAIQNLIGKIPYLGPQLVDVFQQL